MEDFVDEDTGEVVSIERNEIIIDRETILESEHVDLIVDSGAKTILLHKEDTTLSDYAIIYNTLQKDPCNSEKEAVLHIYRQFEMPSHRMKQQPVMLSTNCFSLISDTISAKLAVTGSIKNLTWKQKCLLRSLTKEDIIQIIKYLDRAYQLQNRCR